MLLSLRVAAGAAQRDVGGPSGARRLTDLLHFVPVGLSPVLDGLLLLLRGAQLLSQLLQLLLQRGHLVAFAPRLFFCSAQPTQLATHPLALCCVGILQTQQLVVERPILLVLET